MNNILLLTTDTAADSSTGSIWILVGELVFFGVLMYFILIRPQKKQQKKTTLMLSTLAAGDSVLTSSGMYGVVIDVMDDIIIVEFGNNKNCRIPMKKSSVVEIEKPEIEKK